MTFVPGQATHAMTCAGLLGIALGNGVKNKEGQKKDLLKDAAVKAGLKALHQMLEDFNSRDPNGLYMLWSLERMGVVYGLKKVGDRDWYRWGADHLLSENTGTWGGTYGFADTCFAILFLKRANVAEDLTRQPEQVKAFRDTWELGIHSYLTYLRDRLTVARELLTESGSVFVQIGDENVHGIREIAGH